MPADVVFPSQSTLVDAVDHLLNRGAVLTGDATLSVAGVDLIYVGLNVLVASVETLRQHAAAPHVTARRHLAGHDAGGSAPRTGPRHVETAERTDTPAAWFLPPAENSDPSLGSTAFAMGADVGEEPPRSENGLARLVLALVDLLRQLVERQAVRRMEAGGLSETEIERMGQALMELADKVSELCALFGLKERDLAIDLGPIGRLA